MRRALAAAAALLLAASAWAYIPPSHFILKNMASKRAGLKGVRIVSVVIGYDGGKPTGQRFKAITIYTPGNKTMRSQALDEQGNELFGVEKQTETLPLSLLVLYDPYAPEIISALKKVEIPVHAEDEAGEDTAALRRWDGTMAWVLGATPTKKEGPQLWVEKDTFLPARLLVDDQDIQYAKYRYSKDLPYPRSTTIANRSGVIQIEEDVTEVQINPSAKVEQVQIANGYTDAGNSSSLKGLIRKYYAGLR